MKRNSQYISNVFVCVTYLQDVDEHSSLTCIILYVRCKFTIFFKPSHWKFAILKVHDRITNYIIISFIHVFVYFIQSIHPLCSYSANHITFPTSKNDAKSACNSFACYIIEFYNATKTYKKFHLIFSDSKSNYLECNILIALSIPYLQRN